MKTQGHKNRHNKTLTLADLVSVVSKATHNDRLSALIVADLINSRRIHLEGAFRGKRIIIG